MFRTATFPHDRGATDIDDRREPVTTTEPSTAGSDVNIEPVSPEAIVRLASGFMAAKHLFAASELGVFEALADAPATLDALAARTGLTRRAARISADAMVALGLLERDGDLYRNGPAAAHYLAGRTPGDLRPLLRFWDTISYPTWEALAEALGSGPPREVFDLDDAQQEIVSAGIEAILAGPAHALPEVVDLSLHRRLLDVGGGTGSWSIAAVRRHPHLEATVFELPVTAEIARARIAETGLADRISVVAGDAMANDLPGGHDAFLVANLVHYCSPADNLALLRRVRAAAPAGGRLLLADFWTDPTHTQPVQAALMAGEFAVHLRDGDVYSVDEVRGWLTEAGWRFVEHTPLAGPQSVIVAEAN
jgi:SAM-dependent methyltransferase